jgi:drug/metabolite transporter (DMT)-like permease
MSTTNSMRAIWVLVFASSIWGLTWWPLKNFAAQGLSGPLLAAITYGFAGLLGLPLVIAQRKHWRGQTHLLVLIALIGGWGNTAFVSAIVLGDVVRVMLLFYLAPMWSVLGGRLLLGEHVSRRRALAVVLSLAGAFMVVGGMAAFAAPPSAADMLAVTAGLAFSGNNILARMAQDVPAGSKSAGLLLGCGVTSLLMFLLLPLLSTSHATSRTLPDFTPSLLILLAVFSVLWLSLVTYAWQWSVTRMEAGRSGVITIIELIVAILSATLLGSETMTLLESVGAALIGMAAVLEATDPSGNASQPHTSPLPEKYKDTP